MDKSGYTDMTSIQILVFFALVIIIAVYVTVTNNRRKQNLIIKKLKNGWGKPSQRKYSVKIMSAYHITLKEMKMRTL